jgi:hypothetical protein
MIKRVEVLNDYKYYMFSYIVHMETVVLMSRFEK